jgi:carboxyl-terminal processing protease
MSNEYNESVNQNSEKPNRPSPLQPLYFAGVLILGMFIGTNLSDRNLFQVKSGTEENPNKLVSLIDFIEDNYVDSVDKRKLIDDAIGSILRNLDPHSYYITPEELAASQEQIEGKFDGIGVEFMILRDTLMVVKTIPGGPSDKAGLVAGDRIVRVEDVNICGKELNSDKAQKLLKGKKGSEVRVSIFRKGEPDLKVYAITRGSIPLESVPVAFMAGDSVGYIKVERFSQNTYDEFYSAVDGLKNEGCSKLLIDLRGNGGGLMDQAVKMIEEFLPDGKLILYTEGVHQGKEVLKSSKKGSFQEMEVVVMIDQGSASASEIVAGALQDWDRSITIGRRSFGKGLVQHEIELPDKSAMRLTVARYYTPTGRCIQKPYGDSIDYSGDIHQRLLKGEFTVADSIHFPDSLRYTTLGDKKRTVYGGGGIMPDVFVPIDSVFFSGLLGELSYAGVIREYTFNYLDHHRKDFAKFKTADEFIEKFQVSDAMLNEMLNEAKKEKIEATPKQVKHIQAELKMRIKGQLARNLFDDTAMYKVILQTDHDFKKALEVARTYRQFAAN